MVEVVAISGVDDSCGMPEYPKVRPFLFEGEYQEQRGMETLEASDEFRMMFREKVCQLEDRFRDFPQVECELNHYFAPGVYVREIVIPAKTFIIGKIHLHEHMNTLISGDVSILTEFDGVKRIQGPLQMVSKPGTKRVLLTHSEVRWSTTHLNPTNERDLKVLESQIIAPDYDSMPLTEHEYKQLAGG